MDHLKIILQRRWRHLDWNIGYWNHTGLKRLRLRPFSPQVPSPGSSSISATTPATPSTMHQTLYVEELVRRIASNADDGSPGSASLLALACCCRALESPVMDVLWQRQKHLHIILRSLPADCWNIRNDEYVSGDVPTL